MGDAYTIDDVFQLIFYNNLTARNKRSGVVLFCDSNN